MQCICLKYYHCVMIFFVFIDKMIFGKSKKYHLSYYFSLRLLGQDAE